MVTLAGDSTLDRLHGPLTHALQDASSVLSPRQDGAQQLGAFCVLDPQGGLANGPEWAAPKNHRLPDTPEQAERPVSEGPQKMQGQVVRQTLH